MYYVIYHKCNVKMRLLQQIRKNMKKEPTVYQRIANKHGVSYGYVAKIAEGYRTPTKKVGLEILNELKKLANQ